MKARLPKGYGRPDPNAMMRQVQKMQDEIRAKQEELEAKEYTGTASGEMVTVTRPLTPRISKCWKTSLPPPSTALLRPLTRSPRRKWPR